MKYCAMMPTHRAKRCSHDNPSVRAVSGHIQLQLMPEPTVLKKNVSKISDLTILIFCIFFELFYKYDKTDSMTFDSIEFDSFRTLLLMYIYELPYFRIVDSPSSFIPFSLDKCDSNISISALKCNLCKIAS